MKIDSEKEKERMIKMILTVKLVITIALLSTLDQRIAGKGISRTIEILHVRKWDLSVIEGGRS